VEKELLSANAISFLSPDECIAVGQDDEGEAKNPSGSTTGEELVYIIYTSGTTGKPKGVEVRERGVLNMIHFFHQVFGVSSGMRMSQVANITFDASAFEIWPCLTHGGSLHIAPRQCGPIRN
jgi:non-ribosomal peptide synthetase component F